LSLDGP